MNYTQNSKIGVYSQNNPFTEQSNQKMNKNLNYKEHSELLLVVSSTFQNIIPILSEEIYKALNERVLPIIKEKTEKLKLLKQKFESCVNNFEEIKLRLANQYVEKDFKELSDASLKVKENVFENTKIFEENLKNLNKNREEIKSCMKDFRKKINTENLNLNFKSFNNNLINLEHNISDNLDNLSNKNSLKGNKEPEFNFKAYESFTVPKIIEMRRSKIFQNMDLLNNAIEKNSFSLYN